MDIADFVSKPSRRDYIAISNLSLTLLIGKTHYQQEIIAAITFKDRCYLAILISSLYYYDIFCS